MIKVIQKKKIQDYPMTSVVDYYKYPEIIIDE